MQNISAVWWKVCFIRQANLYSKSTKITLLSNSVPCSCLWKCCISKQNVQPAVCRAGLAGAPWECVCNICSPSAPFLWTLSFQHTLNFWMKTFLSSGLFMFSSANGAFFCGLKNQSTKTCYSLKWVCLDDLIPFFFLHRIWQMEHLKQTWTCWTWRKGRIITTLTKNQGKAVILKLCYPLCIHV